VKLMNPPQQLSLAGPVIPVVNVKVPTNTDLQNLVRLAGVDRVLEAAVAVERT
jgi:hypothetical protein